MINSNPTIVFYTTCFLCPSIQVICGLLFFVRLCPRRVPLMHQHLINTYVVYVWIVDCCKRHCKWIFLFSFNLQFFIFHLVYCSTQMRNIYVWCVRGRHFHDIIFQFVQKKKQTKIIIFQLFFCHLHCHGNEKITALNWIIIHTLCIRPYK